MLKGHFSADNIEVDVSPPAGFGSDPLTYMSAEGQVEFSSSTFRYIQRIA